MRRKFFFQQNDTKINDFDEGVLILEPYFFLRQFHIHFLKSKVTIELRGGGFH